MSDTRHQTSDSANTPLLSAPSHALNSSGKLAYPVTPLLLTVVCALILSLATAVSPSALAAMDELTPIVSIVDNGDEPGSDTLELTVTSPVEYEFLNQFFSFQCVSHVNYCAIENHSNHSPRAPPHAPDRC